MLLKSQPTEIKVIDLSLLIYFYKFFFSVSFCICGIYKKRCSSIALHEINPNHEIDSQHWTDTAVFFFHSRKKFFFYLFLFPMYSKPLNDPKRKFSKSTLSVTNRHRAMFINLMEIFTWLHPYLGAISCVSTLKLSK